MGTYGFLVGIYPYGFLVGTEFLVGVYPYGFLVGSYIVPMGSVSAGASELLKRFNNPAI